MNGGILNLNESWKEIVEKLDYFIRTKGQLQPQKTNRQKIPEKMIVAKYILVCVFLWHD